MMLDTEWKVEAMSKWEKSGKILISEKNENGFFIQKTRSSVQSSSCSGRNSHLLPGSCFVPGKLIKGSFGYIVSHAVKLRFSWKECLPTVICSSKQKKTRQSISLSDWASVDLLLPLRRKSLEFDTLSRKWNRDER